VKELVRYSIARWEICNDGHEKLVCCLYKAQVGEEDLCSTGAEGACLLLPDEQSEEVMERPL
jgi:hypothetical protein